MGGHLRLCATSVVALVLFALAAPATAFAGTPAANHGTSSQTGSSHASKVPNHASLPVPAATTTATVPSASAVVDTSSIGVERRVLSAAAPADASTSSTVPGQIERSKPRADQPSERADHVSLSARGRHLGAGEDSDDALATALAAGGSASSGGPAPGSPSARTEAATAPVAQRVSSKGGTSTPPPVIVEPPAAPQPLPPVGADQVLTGARLDWILVGVVVALAAAVVAAVRVATHRGRRPPG